MMMVVSNAGELLHSTSVSCDGEPALLVMSSCADNESLLSRAGAAGW